MAKAYAKGYRSERNLLHTLASLGFMAIRAPRSGRIGLPSPDIVAIKNGKMYVIECKAREGAFTVDSGQLEQLRSWQNHGAIALLAWKMSRKDWKFLHLADVASNNGNVGKKFAMKKGFSMEKLSETIL